MIINHTISSINSYGVLTFQHWNGDRASETLSSDMRINVVLLKEDTSGLLVSEKMRYRSLASIRQREIQKTRSRQGRGNTHLYKKYHSGSECYCDVGSGEPEIHHRSTTITVMDSQL